MNGEESSKKYLLDYRQGGTMGPMKILTMSFAVDEKDYDKVIAHLSRMLLVNERAFTIGEYEEPEELTAPYRNVINFGITPNEDVRGTSTSWSKDE
ncbi:MAG: hypothetical protein E7Z65_06290 [Thermoplasmata archaeon]|nr:hypothetical protein [Thermoplasmata archaeon]